MKGGDFDLQPQLTGELIQLRPILPSDFEELYQCASDPEIWRQHPQPTRYQREVFMKYFEGALASKGALVCLDRRSGKMIGSSRFHDLKPDLRQVTVGYTFLGAAYWGGKYNGEMKSLMLNHAFRFVDSVIFQIGEHNIRSRRAIEKIGANLIRHEVLDGNPHVIYKIGGGK